MDLHVSAIAAIANSKITLNEVSAGLPGGTDFSVFGSISGEGPKPSAALSYEMASENIRAVARWLGVDVDGIRADRLRRFSLTGGVKGTPDKLDISDLDMRIDDTAIRGAIINANILVIGTIIFLVVNLCYMILAQHKFLQ